MGSMGQVMEEMAKPPAKWIALESWKECRYMSEMIPTFSGICSHMTSNPQYWLNFSNSNEPFRFLNEADNQHATSGNRLKSFYSASGHLGSASR